MIDPKTHIGETYGIYEIIDILPSRDKYGHLVYRGKCLKCGYEKIGAFGEFSAPSKITSVCNHKRANGDPIPYGHKWNNKRIGKIFKDMVRRCYNQNDKDYSIYGGKGVTIYGEWLSNPLLFEKWALNNGYHDDLTIDRIDSDKDYCPENCQWISLEDNARKAGKVNWVTVNNETLTGRQWSERFNLSNHTINDYIRKYGVELTTKLIQRMLEDSPKTKHRGSKQTWFDVYEINTIQN